MIAGIFVGGIIWAIYFVLFLVFPGPSSLFAALLVGPYASGYFSARLGGHRAAFVPTVLGSIAALALSVIYLPDTSWAYPHHLWAGVIMLTTLLVLGNFLISSVGTSLGIQVAGRDKLKERPLENQTAEVRSDGTSVATTPQTLDPLKAKMLELKVRQLDLLDDLAFLNDLNSAEEDRGLEEISPELLEEKKNLLQKQLLDLILESERLSREYASNGRVPVKV
jgi:hypothetical protein